MLSQSHSRQWWAVWFACYAAMFLCLDWVSQRFADQAVAASSWNPAAALPFIAIALYGRKSILAVLTVAIFSSMLLRSESEPIPLAIAEGLVISGVYSVSAILLLTPNGRFDPRLLEPRDLVLLLTAAFISSFAAAVVNAAGLMASLGLSGVELLRPSLRYWVGDLIGITIVAPLGLLIMQRRLALTPTRLELLQYGVTAALLFVAFTVREAGRFPYFYFLFFPVIWIGLTSGLEGAVAILALIQVGMVGVVFFSRLDLVDIADFQARMLALAATGLIAGALVSAQRRADERSRAQQVALSQIETRGTLVELGTAIAHEVNQPLSAAGTYASLVVEALAAEKLSDTSITENARNVVRQIHRASSVVRKVRALVRPVGDEKAAVGPDQVVREVLDLIKPEATNAAIEVRMDVDPRLHPIVVDRLQIEQALVNLTRNAIEAVRDAGTRDGLVSVYAKEVAHGAIELGVVDNGPGFPPDFTLDSHQPFKSSKQDGLGVGLSLCQTVALANGAQLVIHPTESGAHVALLFDAERHKSHG